MLEEGIVGDFALVKAWKADTKGNLIFRFPLSFLFIIIIILIHLINLFNYYICKFNLLLLLFFSSSSFLLLFFFQ